MSTDRYVTAAEAAELAGVSLRTFRSWKTKGYIRERSVTRSDAGQFVLLYDPREVMHVEARTRTSDPTQQRARKFKGA